MRQPKVIHQKFTEGEINQVRQILGIRKREGRFLEEATVSASDSQLDRIREALGVDDSTARRIARMADKNWPTAGYAVQGPDGRAESVVVITIGDRPPEEVEGVLAHELGHALDYEAAQHLPEDDIRNDSLMREMVAVIRSRGAPGYGQVYALQVRKLEDLYNKIKDADPGRLRGMSFQQWWEEAQATADALGSGTAVRLPRSTRRSRRTPRAQNAQPGVRELRFK